MANFESAIGYVLVNEGSKLLDRRATTGEYSKYGISLKLASALGLCASDDYAYIDNLNVQSATEFYHMDVWIPLLDQIAAQSVATKIFDMIVNMGQREAITLAQRACTALGATVKADGLAGYMTLTAINTCNAGQLVLELCAECVAFYKALVDKDPAKYQQDWESWKARGEKRPL